MLLDKFYCIGFIIFTLSRSFIPFSACADFFRLFVVAMTCLFIGSKIEEEMRPVPVVIRVFYRIYQRRTGQEITKLTETDPVLFWYKAFPDLDFPALAFHSNWHWKAHSLHIWISLIRHYRSSTTIHLVLHPQAGMRLSDGSTFLEHSKWHVFLPNPFHHVANNYPSVSPTHPTPSPALQSTSLRCISVHFHTS